MKFRGIMAGIITAAVACCSGGISAVYADSPITLAMFSYHTVGTAEDNLSVAGYGNTTDGYIATAGANHSAAKLFASIDGSSNRKLEWSKDMYKYKDSSETLAPAMTAGKKNLWGTAPYFIVKCPTTGYKSITFTAYIGGTKSGPANYKLQYSTDGTTYTDVATASAISDNKNLASATFSAIALPEAAADIDMLYLKMITTDNVTISGGAYSGTSSGEAAINDVKICGAEISAAATTTAATKENAVKLNDNDTQYTEANGDRSDAFYYNATTDAETSFSSIKWYITADGVTKNAEKAITKSAGGGSVIYGAAVGNAPYGSTAQVEFN